MKNINFKLIKLLIQKMWKLICIRIAILIEKKKFRQNKLIGYDYIYDENHKTQLISFHEGQEDMLEFIKEN